MTEKRFNKIKVYLSYEIFDNDNQKQLDVDRVVDLLNAFYYENEQLKIKLEDIALENENAKESNDDAQYELYKLKKENEQLKQFPVKLDNRISKLEESLKALKEMETDDLNTQAVEDVATVIGMSLNALLEFRKELNGDVE